MSLVAAILEELDQQAPVTRRVLERVPAERLGWRPHPKSMSLGQLALHVATTPGNVAALAVLDSYELRGFSQEEAASLEQVLTAFEASLDEARRLLAGMSDERAQGSWTATQNGAVKMTMPRIAILRNILLNHGYHHRGQLTVYLRLLDVPLPSVFGPSADENPFA